MPPDSPATIGVGVIGLGFIGATHVRAYDAAERAGLPCRLVAVSDRRAELLSGLRAAVPGDPHAHDPVLFDPAQVRVYLDASQLIADSRVRLVSICTHTDTHVDLATAALRAGKHALVEKPVALASADVRGLAKVAAQSGRLCMPAMCMRFWPEWVWVKDRITDGSLGRVKSATFQRLGSPPEWADFYRDLSRSGGSLFDLHIHDADFVRWCFGTPREVLATGSIMHATTLYRFPPGAGTGGPEHVAAECGQDLAPGSPATTRFMVAFEQATVDFDASRSPTLLISREGASHPVALPTGVPDNGYDGEVRHLVDAIAQGRAQASLRVTLDDAVETTRLVEAKRKSIETAAPVRL